MLAEQVTAQLLAEGYHIYSPIVNCHAMAEKYALPTEFDFWLNFDIDMLRRCDKLFVLTIAGWRESKGVSAEIDFAQRAGIETGYVNEEGKLRWQP